jgi:hypothetical protein
MQQQQTTTCENNILQPHKKECVKKFQINKC